MSSESLPSVALRFEGPLTVAEAGEALVRLREHLACSESPTLDVAGVTQIDGAGVQLLLFAAREARAAGRTLVLQAPSRAVRAALSMGRLREDLQAEPSA